MTVKWSNLSAIINGQPLFKPITLAQQDDAICFWGASGQGKTTLLRVLTGFSDLYHGEVFWDGKNLKELSWKDRARIREGKVRVHFQSHNLFPELSVEENVLIMFSKQSLLPKGWISSQAKFLLLDEKKKVEKLSWGERQRAAILRTLSPGAEVVFIDEPFNALDDQTARVLSQWIEEQKKLLGCQLFLTAHSPHLPIKAAYVALEKDGE